MGIIVGADIMEVIFILEKLLCWGKVSCSCHISDAKIFTPEIIHRVHHDGCTCQEVVAIVCRQSVMMCVLVKK